MIGIDGIAFILVSRVAPLFHRGICRRYCAVQQCSTHSDILDDMVTIIDASHAVSNDRPSHNIVSSKAAAAAAGWWLEEG